MIQYRIKRFSWAGEKWSGLKQGAREAGKGAIIGGMIAPGNLTAHFLGHDKVALGITAVGATIGAGIGAHNGYKNGVHNYKMKHDPLYKAEDDKKTQEEYRERIKSVLSEDLFLSGEFNYQDWIKFSESLKKNEGKIIPREILKYINFYTRWKKNIKTWYSLMPENGDPWSIPEFKDIFPIPYDAKESEYWYTGDKNINEIVFLTVNNAGDDGFGCYSFDTKGYGWDTASRGYENSFRKFILDHMNSVIKHSNDLTPGQLKLVEEFKRSL